MVEKLKENDRVFDESIELADNAMLKYKRELFYEWDFEKNDKLGLDVYKITRGSKKKVWWICCKNSTHGWDASVGSRVNLLSGCPYCSGNKATIEDNLLIKHPVLCKEWDYNKNELTPDKYKSKSNLPAWWICSKCESSYNAGISSRTGALKTGCHYCTGQKVNYTNSLASLRPDLAEEWHPTKNDDLTPHDKTSGSGEKVWWLGKCGHAWDAIIVNRARGTGCPYCKNVKINDSNSLFSSNYEVAKWWHPTKNGELTPHDVSYGSGQTAWWNCECGRVYKMNVLDRVNTRACPKCTQYVFKPTIGFNDMWTTNPGLAKLLANPEDGYKYAQSSGEKTDWKCPDCGEVIKNKRISHINRRGLKCPICGDGMSFPERFVYHLLAELEIDFVHDRTTEWSGSKRYDFAIPLNNTLVLIETHGEQHFGRGFESAGGRTLEEEQENDKIKETLANENGVEHYIIIDCRISDFEYIKNNVLSSKLNELFNLSGIDWDNINKRTQSSILFKAVDLWNAGHSVSSIRDNLKKERNTITDFLKIGKRLGICEYSKEESYRRGYRNSKGKAVVQMTIVGKYVDEHRSIADAKRKIANNRAAIVMCCIGKQKTTNGFKWMYKEDYDRMIEEGIPHEDFMNKYYPKTK